MTNISLRRTIDNVVTEITNLIADEQLGRAWSKYHALCDMIECDGLGWDDDSMAYWNQATDKAYGECRTAENLALGLLPSYRKFVIDFDSLPEIPFDDAPITMMAAPDAFGMDVDTGCECVPDYIGDSSDWVWNAAKREWRNSKAPASFADFEPGELEVKHDA